MKDSFRAKGLSSVVVYDKILEHIVPYPRIGLDFPPARRLFDDGVRIPPAWPATSMPLAKNTADKHFGFPPPRIQPSTGDGASLTGLQRLPHCKSRVEAMK
jgi:hypothetical protein